LKELQIKRKKTFIIISHKIKPLKICDEIIILEKGKISERFNYPDFYKKYHLLYD
jgi:ABC-type bacteriocin/lantibiotic exporter with double-glycine peptidase domain